MAATIIDGKALAAATKAEAAEKVEQLKAQGINPCLAVILVGENPASQVYVRGKINDCAQCGIESRSINLPADTTQDALLAEVKKLAEDPAVHGILVQLPLPAQIDEKALAHQQAIIRAMTADERRRPDIVLNASRKKRIAVGSGTTVEEINKLLKQFEQIRKLMKQFTDMGGKPGRKGRPGRGMRFPS